jgi:2-polyprenyl-6-methoxyphenol hydroxylase-like FAD-dependent oxidoreductase
MTFTPKKGTSSLISGSKYGTSQLPVRVLISGAGIAGPTLAYWLAHYGFKPTIIETAPRLRTGGYVIDFWGAGYDVADRLGLLPEIHSKGYKVRELRVVGRNGNRVAGFPVDAFFRMAHGRYISLARSELAGSIFNKIGEDAEAIFGDSVDRIDQTGQAVSVTFRSGYVREFDLVVGADGLHSRVRELAFGAESEFEKYLGFKVAAFQVEDYRPKDELVYVLYTEVGQQVGRFTMLDNRTLFLFTFADNDAQTPESIDDQKAILRKRFGNSGPLYSRRARLFQRFLFRSGESDTHEPGEWTVDARTGNAHR